MPRRPSYHSLLLLLAAGPAAAGPPASGPMPHLVDLYGDPLPPGAVARLGSVRLRHSGLTDFTLPADGEALVSVGGDQVVRRWDLATGRQVRAVPLLVPPGERASPEALSPDGRRVAVQEGPDVVVYDARTGRPVTRFPADPKRARTGPEAGVVYHVLCAVFSPDGSRLAVGAQGDAGPRLALFTLATGRALDLPLEKLSPGDRGTTLLTVQFSRDGRRLAAHGPFRPGLVVFDAADGRVVFSAPDVAHGPALSPDGSGLAVRGPVEGRPGAAVVQRVALASGERTTPNGLDATAGDLAYSPDGRLLASVTDHEMWLVDAATGRVRHRLPGGARPGVRFSADGRLLASTPDGCRIQVWDVAAGRARHDRAGWFNDEAAVSPDGGLVAVPVWDGGGTVIELWDTHTGGRARSLPRTECYPDQLAFSPDGWRLTAFWGKSWLYTWSATSGVERGRVQLGLPEGWGDSTTSVFSSDGRRVAAVDSDRWEPDRARLEVWATRPAALLHRFLLPPSVFDWDCLWAPGGRTALLPGEGGSALVDADTGRVGVRIPVVWMAPRPKDWDPRIPFIDTRARPRFSPDGRLVAGWSFRGDAAGPDRLEVWEVASGRSVTGAAVGLPPTAKFALAAAARALVVADGRDLRVIDLATGAERGRYALPPGPWADRAAPATALWAVAGGRGALTTHPDGTALIWDLSAFPPPRLSDRHGGPELRAWWADLADPDAARAYAAGWKIAEAPAAAAVGFLRERVRPARPIDPAEVRARIAELDSPAFAVRETAARRLLEIGPAALPYLRPPPAGLSAERLDRAGKLAERLSDPVPPSGALRAQRAVAVLERVGTDDARTLLEELARGAADAPETEAARSALGRMRQGWAGP